MRLKTFAILFIIAFALQACLPATVTPIPSLTPTRTPIPTATASPTLAPSQTPTPRATRVLILSIDGLRPDAIFLAPMPNLIDLMEYSAYSITAQTIYPSVTLPSHSSMLTGLCPSKHGVDWNDYEPEKGFAIGTDLFDIAHAAGLQTVMVVGKEKLRQITEPSSTDIFIHVEGSDLDIANELIADFPQDFDVLFVHFPTPDRRGHKYGWMSPDQLSAVAESDEALGLILAALDTKGLRDETLIIVTADHGGHGLVHGTEKPEDMNIPWIASGPGIIPGQLKTQVHTMDTAATAAFVLNLTIPAEWDGAPVYEALGLPVEKQSVQCSS